MSQNEWDHVIVDEIKIMFKCIFYTSFFEQWGNLVLAVWHTSMVQRCMGGVTASNSVFLTAHRWQLCHNRLWSQSTQNLSLFFEFKKVRCLLISLDTCRSPSSAIQCTLFLMWWGGFPGTKQLHRERWVQRNAILSVCFPQRFSRLKPPPILYSPLAWKTVWTVFLGYCMNVFKLSRTMSQRGMDQELSPIRPKIASFFRHFIFS